MGCVRLVNWCIEGCGGGRLNENWLVRVENDGSYREILSEVHRPLLDKCEYMADAINAVSISHDRPIPYHLIDIVISQEDGRIHSYAPKHKEWEDLADIPRLVNIADEVRLVSVIIKEQEQATGPRLSQARASVIGNRCFFTSGTSKKTHDVAEQLTFLTDVRPRSVVVTEQHRGKLSTQHLSARKTLELLQAHALHARLEKTKTLTVYRLHLNKQFARAALRVICEKILTEKQLANSEPWWWSETGDVFLPTPAFRFVFFTDGAQADVCPTERLFFEQYFTVPCEIGSYDASCAKNVAHVFSRMVPLPDTKQTDAMEVDTPGQPAPRAASSIIMDDGNVDASAGQMDVEANIAVFDYEMFNAYVMYVSAESPAYQRRVLHMEAARPFVSGLKNMYVKEIGMLALVRRPLYNRMRALCLAILGSLVNACKQIGLRVVLTQTDSVTVCVPPPIMQANGGSLDRLASVLQQIVTARHRTFRSNLKVERQGTSMIVYGRNKHILYDGDHVVHRTGFESKTFCPAMSRVIEEATSNRGQALQLLCSSDSQIKTGENGYSTYLRTFVSGRLGEHAVEKTDLVCESYSLPMPLFVHVLHVQQGEDGLFATLPSLYRVLPEYSADNRGTMPTVKSFMSSLNMSTGMDTKHLDHANIKRVLEAIFTENMGMIRWRLVREELVQHFVLKTISFLTGGRLICP
jgi:hypothetical protein